MEDKARIQGKSKKEEREEEKRTIEGERRKIVVRENGLEKTRN